MSARASVPVSRRGAPRELARRRLILVVAALIAYGSLYPFEVVSPPSLAAAVQDLLRHEVRVGARADAVGNVLLFMPLGVALAACGRWKRPAVAATLCVLGVGYALLLQVLQVALPARDAALADVAWNAVGLVAGGALAPGVDRLRWPPGLRRGVPLVPLALLALWVAGELAPLVPALDWQGVRHALKPLLRTPDVEPSRVALDALRIVAAGSMVGALVDGPRARTVLFALVAATFAVKPLFVGQQLDAGTLLGAAAGAVAVRLAPAGATHRGAALAAALLAIAYAIDGLRPFRLSPQAAQVAWVPFAAVIAHPAAPNVSTMLRLAFTFAAALWLARRAGAPLAPATWALALLAAAVEAAQVRIEGRSPDATDPVLALLAGALLAAATPAGVPSDGARATRLRGPATPRPRRRGP